MSRQELVVAEQARPPRRRRASQDAGGVEMFERLATDPNASVEKIERLMALWERSQDKKAETAFNLAMAAAQKEMRPVAADAWNPSTKSKYASYAALDRSLRPVYTSHGFALSFNTGEAAPDWIRVLCDVTHDAGHTRTYRVDMPADGKGAKGGDVMTKTHAAGSAMSYGMRYLLKLIFNVAVGEDDDDGQRAGRTAPAAEVPSGFDNWWLDLEATADDGWEALKHAWNTSPPNLRKYVDAHRPADFEALKKRARGVK